MPHAEDTLHRWLEMERQEQEYLNWAAFFYPLIDKPEQARLLCEVGLKVVCRQIQAGTAARMSVERVLGQSPRPVALPIPQFGFKS